jgi:hypothetical protein
MWHMATSPLSAQKTFSPVSAKVPHSPWQKQVDGVLPAPPPLVPPEYEPWCNSPRLTLVLKSILFFPFDVLMWCLGVLPAMIHALFCCCCRPLLSWTSHPWSTRYFYYCLWKEQRLLLPLRPINAEGCQRAFLQKQHAEHGQDPNLLQTDWPRCYLQADNSDTNSSRVYFCGTNRTIYLGRGWSVCRHGAMTIVTLSHGNTRRCPDCQRAFEQLQTTQQACAV